MGFQGATGLVLVVDDDPVIRELLMLLMQRKSYSSLSAENGAVAWHILETESRPDVILLDLMMPVINGWELLARIRSDERFRSIPVIVMSAFNPDRYPMEAHDFIKKPFDARELLEKVHERMQGA